MDARNEPAGAAGHQNPARLRDRERATVAVNVAKFGEAGDGHGGNPTIDQQVDILFGARPIFFGNDVRAKKRAVNIDGIFLMQGRKQQQNF